MRLRFCLTDKFIAGFIALTLCLSAYPPELKAQAAAPGQGSVPSVNAMDVSIPEEMGTLKEKFEGRDGRIVFILQDAHAVPDAQRNIQKIIDYVQREYGVALVGLEGAALPLDTLLLQSFPDQARLREVFEDYFQRGELTGASAAALFNEAPSFYQGVENWDLYEEGLGFFLEAAELESKLSPELMRLFSALEIEKEKIYSPELLRADRSIENYHNNKGDLAELLETLAVTQAPEPGSETALLLEEMKSSGRSDENLGREVRQFAEEIRTALSEQPVSKDVLRDLAFFNQKFQEFQNSSIPPEALALSLKELAHRYKIQTQVSQPLRRKIMAQKRIRDLEGTKLSDQIESYARSVKSGLFKNDQERALDALGREYSLIRKLARLELSRSEWLELKKLLSRQDAWPIRQDGVDGAEDAAMLLSRMTPNVEFYRNTEKRDAALFTNTEALMRSRSERSALLVAGGFHAEALTYQLKATGISYVLVMPAISNLPEENAYRDHMTGKVSWSRYFEARDGRVNLYEAFVRGARDALLDGLSQERGPMMKLWRDSVIRALAARSRVAEAAEYTRFIDEAADASEEENRESSAFLEKWKRSVDAFTQKFKELRSADQLTQETVTRLFTPAMIPAATDISMARSELRMDLLPAVVDQLAVSAGLRREAPPAGVLQDHGKKIQLLVTQGIARNVRENSRVLEMGIGSGVMTKILMESAENTPGVSFLGLDINPEAVTAARQMLGTAQAALRMKHSFEVRESDLFSAVKQNEMFDVIFWNPPWSSETSEGALSLAKNDPGFLTLRRFLREAGSFLAPGGKIFLILPPESMEEIWEDAQLLYDISPVPMFERTERRRIGLYTLTARSELRAAPGLEYDLNEETLNQDFWKWFNAELPERELERELFEKIVTGDDAVLRGLLKAYPEKVYVREVIRAGDPESWELNEHDGRTVYLKLSQSFGGIHTLRLKGVRPRAGEDGNFLGYHAGGRGFVPLDADPAGPGKLRFSLREGEYKVFGGSRESSALHEREVIQDMSASDLLKPHVDASLAVGIYRTAGFKGEKLGFSVIGMRGADRRIRPSVVLDDEDEDEDARKLILSVSDYETHEMTPLSPEAAARFALAQGRLMRLYHDAGLYHGYPHFENFGLVPGADFNNLKMEDLIVRDLGSTVRLKDIAAADEKTRLETAAMYRWMDLAKSVRYFRRHDHQHNYFELQLEFLKGYTGSETQARALYEPMSQFSFDLALQYHYSEKHYVREKEKILDFSLPQYAASLGALYEKTKQLEAAAETARRTAEGDVRSARRQAEMARADLEAAPQVLARYAIGEVLEIRPTEGGVGEHGKSLLITAERGRFILKPLTTALYPELIDGARFEVSVVRELVRKGFPAADLVPSDKQSPEFEEDRYFIEASNGKIYLLYRVTEGHTVPVEDLTAAQRENSVRLLAGMHEALRNFKPRGSRTRPSIFDFSGPAEKFKQLEEALLKRQRETPRYFSTRAERFFLEHADFILEQISLLNLNLPPPVIEQLPATLIHGDFHPLNMTYEGNAVRGVFDWDHLRSGFRADDLFHGIFDLKDEREKFNLAGLKEITNLYDRVQPLTPVEYEALPEMARRQLLEYLTWIVRPEKLAERHLYDLSSVDPLEQGLRILDFNEPVFNWFLSNIRVLKDIDAKIASGEFSRAIARSELRTGEELIRSWNEEHYFRQPGKPDDEPGHLGVQFRDVNMETGPGSIYEFDFLKEAARVFLADRDLGLSAEKFASRKEVEKILQLLSSSGVIDEALVTSTMQIVAVLEGAAGKYHSDAKLTGLTDRGEFFQNYYRASSATFRLVPVLVEAMARMSSPAPLSTVHELEDGLEVQSADSLHFSLEDGFQLSQRQQIGLPEGKDALSYFREEPSRAIAVYLRSVEFELPLSHEIRLALIRYQPELQVWLDQQRVLESPSEAFKRTGAHFLKIMESQQSVIGVLWEMYRIGILDALVPEMRRVRDIPSNFNVHAFTVGQHTMVNLKKFEDLRVTRDPQLQEGREIASQLSASGLRQIRLSLLFHDLGKRMVKTPVEPDHAIVSSRDIVPVRFRELGVSPAETANAAWTVRDHMVLNAFARMQDVRFEVKLPVLLKTFGLDPEASLEKLKLLYLISLTDRDSVNPWFPFMGPEILDRLNFIYQTLEDYLKTSEQDRPRHIRDMQIEAHERTYLEWLEYKELNAQRLRGILSQMSVPAIRGYFRNVPIVDEGQFDKVRQGLIDRAAQAAADEGSFDRLMERLFAAFPMDQIRDYSEDESVQRLLFLLHLDYQRDTGNRAPVVYFNPQLSRTYERGYEIVVGSPEDREGFFEKTTGVLFRHRFDIEEADIRTLTSVEVIDTFQGFFQDDYPDEASHIRLQDQLTRDLRDVFNGTLPSVKDLFERDGKPYRSERTLGPIVTEVQFLEDADIYGTRASVFNLKTANRLGLLHTLSLALNQRGINLVAAPVSTHPSMVNDTFYVNRNGEVLGSQEKDQLSSVVQALFSEASIDLSGMRSELRASHLDLLWPDGVTDRDFAGETFQAWKSDWLADDTLAAGLTAWMIGNSLTFEFTGQDGQPVNKGALRVSLTVRQNDSGKIMAIESKGYPGIDSKEMLRGVLNWMKVREVDYVQMDVTYPAFLEAVRDEWNRTRAAGPDPYVLPVRPAGNGTRMYFYLKLLNLDRMPVRSELRSGEESKLMQVFGPQEGSRIQYQARWFAGIFNSLDPQSRKNFLYPNLLLVLLGVKPLYLAVEEGAPSPAAMIKAIDARKILSGSRLMFYADETHLAALLPAAVKILSERVWLEQKGVLGSDDSGALDLMNKALQSGDTQTLFSKTHELMMKIRSDIEKGEAGAMEKAHWFYGLLFGYSKADMESYARAIRAEGKPSLDDPRYAHSRYSKVSLFTESSDPVWMARAEAALDYTFSLLQGVSGFEEAADGYERKFSPEVTAELERLYKEDEGKDSRLLLRPEWPELNRVFDGAPQDIRGSGLILKRALETLKRLDIRPGDTVADLGAGERGGLGLIAAMLGAHVTAVESRPESVLKIQEHYERLSGIIASQGGRFEIVQLDLAAPDAAEKLGKGKFRHVIMTDTVTPSRAMADGTPSAPPTYAAGKVQSIFKTAGDLKSSEPGRVLFSVPEYVQAGGRMTSAVPFLEDFALAVMNASGTAPLSAVFVSVPYSDAIKRGVLYEFKPVKRSELRVSADEERARLEGLSGQDWKSITLEHLDALIARAKQQGREDLAAAGEAHARRMTGNLDRPMVRTDGNDFVGLHSAFFDPADSRRKKIVLEQLARMTNAVPGALFTAETVEESRRLFTKLYDSENLADLEDSEAFLASSLYRRSSVRSELRAPDDKAQILRRVRTETLGAQNPQGTRLLTHHSFEGVLWIWAGRFAYRIEPDLLARKFTFQRYSVDKQTPQGSVYSVPFDEDYIVGRGSGAVPGQYVLATETDNQLSRRHFKLRVSESVWETFFTLEDTGPEGQGSSAGTRAEWTQGDVVISKGFNLHSPPVIRHLSAKVEKLGIKENIPSRGALLPGEFSDGFYPLPAALQARVIQSMREYSEAGYNLTDYLLDRNLNSMISDSLSLQTDPPRIVYHPGIGTRVSNDGQGLAVLRTLIQTDFKTLVATDPAPYSLEEFKTALIRQLGGVAENITVRRDSRGAYLAFFTFNGTTREIIAYYGFEASLKNPEEINKGYQVLINRRHAYKPVSLKAKTWAALNSRKPLVMDEAISSLDPVAGFIISDGQDEISNTEVPEPGLIGLDSMETLKRLPSLNSFAFISSLEYLELVYEKYRAAPSAKRGMPVLLGRSSLVLDSFRRKIAAARQKNDGVERFSLFSALRGGPEYAGHGSGSLWMSEQILKSGKLIHKKGFIQYAILNRSTMTSPSGFDSGGSAYDSEGTGLFILDDNFNDGVDSVMTSDENGDVVNTIQLDHPKFLAAVFGAHYVPGMKRKYPRHQHKIMSYAEAADYLTRLTREKNRPDDSSSSTRSELRQTAETALQALRPDASEDVRRLAAQSVYKSIQIDPDLFLELVREIFQEKVLEAQDREAGSPERGDGALALQAAMDLARKLLVPKDASLPSRKVTMAVHFSKTEDPVSFIQAMIQAVTEGNFSAEVLSDAGTHKAFSRQLTEPLREFFQLKKLKSSDLQKGTTASVEGLGIATAMDAAEGADEMNEMFQGLFFDFEDTGEDPDLRLSGQVLFAALLIKLAVLSSENSDIPAADRAAFLKAELIRAVHEAGYVRVSQDSFQALGSNLIRIAGGSLIGSLIDEMKARTQIGQSA